jgi:hypothetical protein
MCCQLVNLQSDGLFGHLVSVFEGSYGEKA